MVNVTRLRNPGGARSWSWAYRSPTDPDNPVKRWLGRARENRVQERHRPQVPRRLIVRPAL
jgi:hypothetical protein